MQNYKYPLHDRSYNQSFNEFELELNPEFELESDSEYDPHYELEAESDNEYSPDYETDPEFEMEREPDYEQEYDMQSEFEGGGENEFEQEFESPHDEMEAELEYVTNEKEFSNWVNEIVVRDQRRLSPTLRTPLGQRAIKQFSKIAFKTLPYIGRKRYGWQRPYYGRRTWPGYRWWQRRPQWTGGIGIPVQQPAFPEPQQQQQPQQQGFQGAEGTQQPPIQQDGSFKNFVLDTIKNLSEQIAKGNESIMALKNAMTTSAVNNLPAIVQPKSDSPEPPAEGKPPQGPAMPGEFEMEDYEYDNEFESNNEFESETDREITDNESTFNEVTEMQLASELLSVNNEMELDQFLGKLFKKAIGKFSKLLASPQGAILKKLFTQVAGKTIPVLGGIIGGPAGAVIGDKIASVVSSEVYELELEGLSNEDSEFELAKAFVRLAGNAAKELENNRTGNPAKDAEHALIQAAQRFAPGLLQPRDNGNPYHYGNVRYGGNNGRWFRRGNKIIIQDAF